MVNQIEQTIAIIKEALQKLERLKQESNKESSEHQVLLDQLNQIATDISDIKKAIIG
jgi:prefoldin subunit 5